MKCQCFASWTACCLTLSLSLVTSGVSFLNAHAEDQKTHAAWTYNPESLVPFWESSVVWGEPVLFVRDSETGDSRGKVLFPIKSIRQVATSAGDQVFEEGVDYLYDKGTREIVIPAGSKVVTTKGADLRRPANSQAHQLTHRDGDGEILFGAKLEYHQMQTLVTYEKQDEAFPAPSIADGRVSLPRTTKLLQSGEPVKIVLLGDSISTGCNASGWGGGAPFQPAYQDLLLEHLQHTYSKNVELVNLAVGGMATPWGITKVDDVMAHQPDMVILAFGMNDSAGLSAEEYRKNTLAMIEGCKAKSPDTEFILIATMLGNRDWIRLNHDVFPEYRDALVSLTGEGVALADMTSIWEGMLQRKKDADLTGNGVNHPNDFGHRVYAQVLAKLLVTPATE